MSAATIDRYLAPVRARFELKGKSATRPGHALPQWLPLHVKGPHIWPLEQLYQEPLWLEEHLLWSSNVGLHLGRFLSGDDFGLVQDQLGG